MKSGPGRTATLAGFLLGTVSGSGVATTVTWAASPGRCCARQATRRNLVAPSWRPPVSALGPGSRDADRTGALL
ncbi:hypothetical protein ACX80S_02765 [Arthrobacter sp. RHLT1-20]